VQQEQARAQAGGGGGSTAASASDGRRWPTPAITKVLLASYEMTVHRFPAFLRCLEAGGDEGGADADAAAGGAAAGGGNKTKASGAGEGWETSRVNFGTRGWRLLAEGKEGKKDK
jgi:hypothetical protein